MAKVSAGASYEAVLTDRVTPRVDRMIDAIDRLRHAFDQMGPSAARVNRDMGGIANAMNTATRASSSMATRMETIGKTMRGLAAGISGIGQAVGQSMIHMGNQIRNTGAIAAGASAAIGGFFWSAIKDASRANEVLNAFNATMGASAPVMNKWVQDMARAYGMSATDLRESLSGLRATFIGVGFGEDIANGMAKSLTAKAIDFASIRGTMSPAEAMASFQAGISGTSPEVLAKFGIAIKQNQLGMTKYAKAIGKTAFQMDEQQKILARYSAIEDFMEANGFDGDMLRTLDDFANVSSRAVSAWKRMKEEIGKKFMAEGTAVLRIITGLADAIRDLSKAEFSKLAGLGAALGGIGAGMLVLGSALSVIGMIILVFSSIMTSALLAMAGLFAMGPVAGFITAIGVATVAMAALAAYFTVKEFPLKASLEQLGQAFRRVGDDISLMFKGLAGAIALQDWQLAWDIVVAGGELAFTRLGKTIFETLSKAIAAGIETGLSMLTWENIKARLPLSGGYRGPNDPVFWDPFAKTKAAVNSVKNAAGLDPKSIKAKEQELKDLVRFAAEIAAAEAYKLKTAPPGSDFDPAAGEDDGLTDHERRYGKPKLPGQSRSVGSFSGGFATDIANFRPVMSPMERNQEKQITLMEEGNNIGQQTYEAIKENSQVLEFN